MTERSQFPNFMTFSEIVTFLSFIIPEKVIKLGNCDLFVIHNY